MAMMRHYFQMITWMYVSTNNKHAYPLMKLYFYQHAATLKCVYNNIMTNHIVNNKEA